MAAFFFYRFLFLLLFGGFLIQSYHLLPAEGATANSLLFIGSAIGFPFAGWFSDRIRSRQIPLFIAIIMTFVLSTILIYIPHQPTSIVLRLLLFFIGFFIGPQVLIFALARKISPPRSTGISTAVSNFIVTHRGSYFSTDDCLLINGTLVSHSNIERNN